MNNGHPFHAWHNRIITAVRRNDEAAPDRAEEGAVAPEQARGAASCVRGRPLRLHARPGADRAGLLLRGDRGGEDAEEAGGAHPGHTLTLNARSPWAGTWIDDAAAPSGEWSIGILSFLSSPLLRATGPPPRTPSPRQTAMAEPTLSGATAPSTCLAGESAFPLFASRRYFLFPAILPSTRLPARPLTSGDFRLELGWPGSAQPLGHGLPLELRLDVACKQGFAPADGRDPAIDHCTSQRMKLSAKRSM